jgi:hypothetical protein
VLLRVHYHQPGPASEVERRAGPADEGGERAGEESPFLDPHEWKPCPLLEKEEITHDTKMFRFGYAGSELRRDHAAVFSV